MAKNDRKSTSPSTYQKKELGNPLFSGFFEENRRLLWITMLTLFIIAFVVRVYFYDASRAVGEVQYRSAVIARAFYFDRLDSIPGWRKEVNDSIRQGFNEKEPSITEYLVSIAYRIAGGEHLWLARSLTTLFWLISGAFIFLISRNITSLDASVFATAYYLFVPIGIFISTSFQPESLMMMMYLIGIFTIVQYAYKPTKDKLIIAAIVSGFAILVKPLILFALMACFMTVVLSTLIRNLHETANGDDFKWGYLPSPLTFLSKQVRQGSGKELIEFSRKTLLHIIVFSSIILIIGTSYYFYGFFIAGRGLATQASVSFVPHFLLEREYWRGWLLTATGSVGFMPLVLSLLGIPLLRPGIPRSLVTGLWFGYFLFCLVFTFHIHFNQYYHAQLFPIIALSLGCVSGILFFHLRRGIHNWYWWLPVIVSITMIALFTVRDVRSLFNNQAPVETQQTAWEIGELVNHSTNTVLIASYYGRPLMYLAEISGTYWPRRITSDQIIRDPGAREQSVQERLDSLGFDPEYFIVTNFPEFYSHHDDLQEYLSNHCSLLAESDQYLIFHACD
jgi:hypothetical protein